MCGMFCYLRKLTLATASRPKYLFMRAVISGTIYDNCNVKAGFAGRTTILYRPSRIFRTAAKRATFAISAPIITSHRAAKSASDARTPNICINSPSAPANEPGRLLRLSNLLFCWFDIIIYFWHQDKHLSLGMLAMGIFICFVTLAKEYIRTNPPFYGTACILGNHQAAEFASIG